MNISLTDCTCSFASWMEHFVDILSTDDNHNHNHNSTISNNSIIDLNFKILYSALDLDKHLGRIARVFEDN